jgi:hypothetical protein
MSAQEILNGDPDPEAEAIQQDSFLVGQGGNGASVVLALKHFGFGLISSSPVKDKEAILRERQALQRVRCKVDLQGWG